MKRKNKNKLAFIKLIADDNIILHAFKVVNHMDDILPEAYSDYPHRKLNGRATITLQIEKVKNDENEI